MTDLRMLMDLATDQLNGPDLSRTALATAHRRRTRRRGAVAAVAAGIAVGGVIVVPRIADSTPDGALPGDPTAPGPTPTTTPTADGSPDAPPIDPEVTLPAWDPATAGDLPFYPIGHIPTVLAPEGGHSRPGDTTGILALSRTHNDRLAVLYGERGWYGYKRVYEAGDLWDSALSRDGSRVAIVGENGLFWCPAAEECADWRKVDVPGVALGDDARLTWTEQPSTLVLSESGTAYLVDLDTGATTPQEPPLSGVPGDPVVLTDVVEIQGAYAATRRDPEHGDGLVVLDSKNLTTLSFLPFTGRSGEWVEGGQVKPIQWINKLTVLATVLVGDRVWVVTWNYRTGDMGYVSWYPASYDVSLRDLYPS